MRPPKAELGIGHGMRKIGDNGYDRCKSPWTRVFGMAADMNASWFFKEFEE